MDFLLSKIGAISYRLPFGIYVNHLEISMSIIFNEIGLLSCLISTFYLFKLKTYRHSVNSVQNIFFTSSIFSLFPFKALLDQQQHQTNSRSFRKLNSSTPPSAVTLFHLLFYLLLPHYTYNISDSRETILHFSLVFHLFCSWMHLRSFIL